MRIGVWTRTYREGQFIGRNDAVLCPCGEPATRKNAWNPTLSCCDACAYCAALWEHNVDYRRDGNQVIALVPCTDANGSTGVEEIHITSPEHLMRVLGY